MSVTKLTIKKPSSSRAGIIDVTFVTPPRTICMAAFGPHTGQLALNKGRGATELASGAYKLIVNGELQDDLLTVK